MHRNTASAKSHIALAALSLVAPTTASWAQEVSPFEEVTVPGVKAQLESSPNRVWEGELPERVRDLAIARGLDTAIIKYEDKKWLVCTDSSCTLLADATREEIARYEKPTTLDGLRTGDTLTIIGHKYRSHIVESEKDYGIPGLGNFSRRLDGTVTFTPAQDFTGSVTLGKRAQGTAPKASGAEVFSAEYGQQVLRDVRQRILTERDTTFVLVISVPSQCPPCRQYKGDIAQAAQEKLDDQKEAFITINFHSFDEASAVAGDIRLFPTSIVFPAMDKGDDAPFAELSNWEQLPFLKVVGERPGFLVEGRKLAGALRSIMTEARKVSAGVRGIKNTMSDLLSK